MRINFFILIIFFLLNEIDYAVAQSLGLNNATPDASSILDMSATDKGVLIPRMTQAERDAIASPATALLIYQTNNTPGFYSYNGSAWVPLFSTNTGWALTGNSGTVAGTNFLGTTDAVDFRIRTNNVDRMTVLSGGNVGVGTTAPSALLEVASTLDPVAAPTTWANYNMLVRSTTNTNGQGTGIAFVNTTIANNIGAAIIFKRTGGYSQGELQFYTKQSTTNGIVPVQAMVIDNAGNVGVGTATPQRVLHISNTANNLFMLQSTVGGSGNTVNMDFMTYDIGGTVYPTARVSAIDDNNWSSHLAFHTKVPGANTNGLEEKARITTGGYLGVGTTAPESKLQVYGGAEDTWFTIGASDAASYNAGIYMKENETTAGNSRGFKLYYNSWDFYIDRNDGGADANVLFIERTNGDIGIGTTAPAVKLHVAGTIRGTIIQATTNGAGAYQYNTTTNMNVPDYVFDKYYTGTAPENPVYDMMPLDKLEEYIHKNRHLPRVPSRSEINKDGFINTQAISMLTLEKTEENTLYILELNKKIKEQQELIEELRNEMNANKMEMESMIKIMQLQLNGAIEK